MTKKELIKAVADAGGFTKAHTESTLNIAFDKIEAAVKAGETVELHGFGKFKQVQREQRQGRNPRTGEPVTIAATRVVKFKAAKALADAVA